jgi:TRAP-type C4-dicarboxylate transport system permease small subunit
MIIIACDVALRYAANAPLAWAYDFIGLYLMPALFFLPLGYVQRCHGNIAVDLFVQILPPQLRRILSQVGNIAAAVLFAIVWWLFAKKTEVAITTDEEIIGPKIWITWPIYVMVAIGLALFIVRLLFQIFQPQHELDREAAEGGHSE